MADQFVERTSFGGGIKKALTGVVLGIALFFGSFPMLWWNEGRSVARIKTIAEGQKIVQPISSERSTPDNEGQLVHFSGFADTSDQLKDSIFGVNVNAIQLKRTVEIYQWHEKKKSKGENKTEYTYTKKWSEKLIDSSTFRKPQGHKNPTSMPYETDTKIAANVRVDAFRLTSKFIRQIDSFEEYQITQNDYARLNPQLQNSFQLLGNQYFFGNPDAPQIGATRVTFDIVKPTGVSVIGKQSGTMIETYQTKHGTLALLDLGQLSAAEMFQNAIDENTIMTWILRGLGFAMMWVGLAALFGPIKFIANYVPILGGIFEGAIMLITGLIAIVLSFTTIALAWLFYRPLLAIALLSIAAGACYGILKIVKNKNFKAERAEALT